MYHPDDFLERIRQAENAKLDKITRFISDVTIQTTEEVAGKKKTNYQLSQKVFKPDIIFKVFVLTFTFSILTLFIRELFFPKSNFSTIGAIFTLLFLVLLAIAAVHQFIIDKELNFRIFIDNEKIQIDNKVFKWSNIYKTAILTNPSGRTPTKYLIIALNNKTTYEKIQLTNFVSFYPGGFNRKLSKYIGHFKPNV